LSARRSSAANTKTERDGSASASERTIRSPKTQTTAATAGLEVLMVEAMVRSAEEARPIVRSEKRA
jgi:hypothetical protein